MQLYDSLPQRWGGWPNCPTHPLNQMTKTGPSPRILYLPSSHNALWLNAASNDINFPMSIYVNGLGQAKDPKKSFLNKIALFGLYIETLNFLLSNNIIFM